MAVSDITEFGLETRLLEGERNGSVVEACCEESSALTLPMRDRD